MDDPMEDVTEIITPTEDDQQRPQSPLEALRARRDEVAANREILIQIPGQEDLGLKVKYRLLTRDEADEIGKNIRKQTRERAEFMYRVVVDTMVRACQGFYLAPDGVPDDKAEPLVGEDGDVISTFTQLAYGLGWDPTPLPATQRRAIYYVFGENDFSSASHGLLLQRWMNNTNMDVDLDFLQD